MKFTYLLTLVPCLLLNSLALHNNKLLLGDRCGVNSYDTCVDGTICRPPLELELGSNPVCSLDCDRCFLEPGKKEPTFCADGYASEFDGEFLVCNICEKGWYSSDSNNNGLGTYKAHPTDPSQPGFLFPGNVGCIKCPHGYTTTGRGLGKEASDCKFFGQLDEATWKPAIDMATCEDVGNDLETLKQRAISLVHDSQATLMGAAKSCQDLQIQFDEMSYGIPPF